MELRPYQNEARAAVFSEWEQGKKHTLLVSAFIKSFFFFARGVFPLTPLPPFP